MINRLISGAVLLLFFSQAAAQSARVITPSGIPAYIGEVPMPIGNEFGQYRAIGANEPGLYQPAVKGTTYLTDDWVTGTLYITLNRKLENQLFKYDIAQNLFLLKNNEAPEENPLPGQVVNGVNVLAFATTHPLYGEQYFFNVLNAGLKSDGMFVAGFVELLVDGPMSLYYKVETSLQRANYNVALAVGEKQDKILKKDAYYIRLKNDPEIHKLSKNKKNNLALFQQHEQQVNLYLKNNHISFSDKDDLVKVVTYYNSIAN